MALSMFKNALNQKTDATLKNQLLNIYNFFAWPKKDLSAPKVLKLCFVSVKNDPASKLNIVHLTFDIKAKPCLTEKKCNFRTFGVNESFWAKQQSCTS